MGDEIFYQKDGMGMVYKYSKKLRTTDEAVKALFNELVIIDEKGYTHLVPCLWANDEKIQCLIGENISSEDGTQKLKTDIIKLPIIGVFSTDIYMVESTPVVSYMVSVYALFQEDMNQILEQIVLKFDNKKNCRLHTIARNYDGTDARAPSLKILKSIFNITVEGIGVPVETHE